MGYVRTGDLSTLAKAAAVKITLRMFQHAVRQGHLTRPMVNASGQFVLSEQQVIEAINHFDKRQREKASRPSMQGAAA